MGLFGKKDNEILKLRNENKLLRKRNRELKHLCNVKDSFFKEMISDGLRHKSSLAGKHMADLKKYKQGK